MPFIIGTLLAVGFAGLVGIVLLNRERPTYPDPGSLIIEPNLDLSVEPLTEGAYVISGETAMPVRVHGGSHPDAIDRSTALPVDLSERGIIVLPQPPAAHHYFELVHDTGETRVVGPRVLRLPGAINLRDLGGYPTLDGYHLRWGRVLRAGRIDQLTDESWAYLQSIGLTMVCDFRSHDEADKAPDRLPPNSRIDLLHLPLHSEPDTFNQLRTLLFDPARIPDMLPEIYTRTMIDDNPQVFAEVLHQLADADNLPLLFHCTAGKDRTGVMAALLLSLLRVPRDIIVADYTLSNRDYAHFHAYAAQALQPIRWLGIRADDLQPMMLADARTINHTLDYITEHYGSVQQYLYERAAVDDSLIDRLRANLLE